MQFVAGEELFVGAHAGRADFSVCFLRYRRGVQGESAQASKQERREQARRVQDRQEGAGISHSSIISAGFGELPIPASAESGKRFVPLPRLMGGVSSRRVTGTDALP